MFLHPKLTCWYGVLISTIYTQTYTSTLQIDREIEEKKTDYD